MLALATGYAVFVLPFRFASSVPVSQSSAYVYGAGNAPAEIGAALISLLVAFAAYRTARPLPLPASVADAPGRQWLAWAMAAHAAVVLCVGAGLVFLQQPYGEAQYFLTQLTKGLAGRETLYRDIAFAYGPLLYYGPLLPMRALGRLHVSGDAAYVAVVLLAQMAGIALLLWVVRALPLRPSLQRFAFAVFAVGALSPTLGVNYCLLRFLAAPAAAMLVAQQRSLPRAAAAAALAMLLALGISAECGVGLLGGACALAALHVLRTGRPGLRWLSLPAAALAAAGLFAAALGPETFRMIAQAGRGGYDLLLTPEPRTLLLLVAAVGLAPLAAARAARSSLDDGAPVVALYGTALGMLPVALGRADAIHEYFFGLPAALLSLVALSDARLRLPARAWLAALLLWAGGTQAANLHLYWPRLRALARSADRRPPAPVDLEKLAAALHGSRVFVQYPLPQAMQQQMAGREMLAPAFFAGFSSVWSEAPAERIVREMRTAGYALVANEPMADDADEPYPAVERWQRLGLPYRRRHPRFDPGLLLDRELHDHWHKIADFSETALYRLDPTP